MNIQTSVPTPIDLDALKARQQATWSSGDYAVIGTTLQIVGETLCEAVDLRGGERVLDVAAGNGNATLAAARRFAKVVSTDYVRALLERGQERAAADGLAVTFQEADVEGLPFPEGSFDVVLSTFGVMFAPDHKKAASEMLRVCKPDGRIGLANWTPEGFVGQLFKTVGRHVPPAPGTPSPALWGTHTHLVDLLGNGARVASTERQFTFRYRSPNHWVQVFRGFYGPVLKAFAALDGKSAQALDADLHELIARFNKASDGTVVIPGTYLEVVATKKN